MARLSVYIPLLLMLTDTIRNRKAKKVIEALPMIQGVRSRFRLAYKNGAGVTFSPEEVQEIGAHLRLDE